MTFWFIVGMLAVWRLTFDMTSDLELAGPFDLYDKIRQFSERPWVLKIIYIDHTCPYCVSFWMGHMIGLLLPIYPWSWQAIPQYFAVSWGLSGGVILMYRLVMHIFKSESPREV